MEAYRNGGILKGGNSTRRHLENGGILIRRFTICNK